MKKAILSILVVMLLLLQLMVASALTAGDAKKEWQDAKADTRAAQEEHRDAKIEFAGNKSEENRKAVVDTGKDVLHAALDEAEAWLVWKELEAEENPDVPESILDNIKDDVDANLGKIDALKTDVDNVKNQLELGLVWLKMVGKYVELLSDVARNTGAMWVHIGNEHLETAEEYEQKLRDQADDMSDNELIIGKLDMAKAELKTAQRNLENAGDTYKMVRLPGTPLLKFAEGNNYLRAARANLLSAHKYLNQAYAAMVAR
jgi:hypothetical protein